MLRRDEVASRENVGRQRLRLMDSRMGDTGGGWRVTDFLGIVLIRNAWFAFVANVTDTKLKLA